MKKHISLSYAVLIIAAASLGSCAVDVEEVSKGGIAGIVADKVTGEPVPTVKLKLSPGGNSTVTGSDGSFQFEELEAGEYTVTYTKDGYRDGTEKLLVKNTLKTDAHLLIERIPAIITTDKEVLDFGENSGVTSLSFNLINSSYKPLEWNVDYTCTWIKEIKPKTSGILNYGKTATLIVEIDREELEAGNNETYIVVYSEDGSAEVKVMAVGGERHIPSLIVSDASSITSNSATLNGKIQDAGSPEYFERGFVYAQASMPTVDNGQAVTVARTDDSGFSYVLDGLELGKKCFVRSYAKSIIKRAETVTYSSNEISFVTKSTSPVVTISDVTEINVTQRTAMLNGKIENVGDPAYTEKGFVYATHNNPLYENDLKVSVPGSEIGLFRQKIEGLEIDTQYYVRAYVKGVAGILYSSEECFALSSSEPTVSITGMSDLSVIDRTITIIGNVDNVGVPPYTERGFIYSTHNNPMYENDYKCVVEGAGSGTFRHKIENLSIDVRYYVRAYAVSEIGTFYSDETSFILASSAPVVSIKAVSDISVADRSVTFNGCVDAAGEPAYTEKGFVYGDTNNPTINDTKILVEGTGVGSYSVSVKNLELDKKYYLRAYAIGKNGVSYSDEVQTFVIQTTVPVVSMVSVDKLNVLSLTARFKASVTDEGNPSYVKRGFVYGTKFNPTLSDSKIDDSGTGVGSYESEITGLSMDTKYYVRAFVTNSLKTVYSAECLDFKLASTNPAVSETSVIEKSYSSKKVRLAANVTQIGAPAYTEKGFVWGNQSYPTIETANSIKIEGLDAGVYYYEMNSVTLDAKYYVRAFIKNTNGVFYGEETWFALSPQKARVSSAIVSDVSITDRTARLKAIVTSVGDPSYTERGFVYSTENQTPSVSDKTIVVSVSETNDYEAKITELEIDKTYYVRSYVKNLAGVSYGSEVAVFNTNQVLPVVTTDSVTDEDKENHSVVLHGTVKDSGAPAYTERGFVYSDIYESPTIYDNKIVVSGSGNGSFEYRLTELPSDRSYYVRAYATNVKGTAYGETIKIFYSVFILKKSNIMVQLSDIGIGTFDDMEMMCENSNVAGYSDWRLPSMEELSSIYLNKGVIGQFAENGGSYWSSKVSNTSSRYYYYYYMNFSTGSTSIVEKNSAGVRARCVRTIDSSK